MNSKRKQLNSSRNKVTCFQKHPEIPVFMQTYSGSGNVNIENEEKGGSDCGSSISMRAKLDRLRKENKRLKMEREIILVPSG